MLTNIYTRKSDTFFCFVVVGRADCLPTPCRSRYGSGREQEQSASEEGNEGSAEVQTETVFETSAATELE
jgi:hypothetical protein